MSDLLAAAESSVRYLILSVDGLLTLLVCRQVVPVNPWEASRELLITLVHVAARFAMEIPTDSAEVVGANSTTMQSNDYDKH
jgi:hypothetical protein